MGGLVVPGALKRSGLSLAIVLGLVLGSVGPSTASTAQARELASPDAREVAALLVGERDSAVSVELAAFLTRELGALETRELAALLASTLASPLEQQHGTTPVATTSTTTVTPAPITTGTGLGSLTSPATCCTADQVQLAQSIINARSALVLYVHVGIVPIGFGLIILRGLTIQAARLPQPLQAIVLGYLLG